MSSKNHEPAAVFHLLLTKHIETDRFMKLQYNFILFICTQRLKSNFKKKFEPELLYWRGLLILAEWRTFFLQKMLILAFEVIIQQHVIRYLHIIHYFSTFSKQCDIYSEKWAKAGSHGAKLYTFSPTFSPF